MRNGPAVTSRSPETWALVAMVGVSALCCLMGAVMPMSDGAPVRLDFALAGVAAGMAAALWCFGDPVRRGWVHAVLLTSVAGATVIIAVAFTPAGAVSTAVSYLWPALYAAFFLGRSTTRFYVGLIAACYAAALWVNPFPGVVQVWVLLVFTTAVGAEAVAMMVAKLAALAATDQLTGLPNRTALRQAAIRALSDVERRGSALTLTVLDLDGFKQVNDREGHAAGDRLLVELASAWQQCLRASDVLARQGGDEFVLLLPGTGAEETAAVLARLRAAAPTAWSAGTAVAEPGDDLDTLLARADERLYADKAQGRVPLP